jgi:hypothetical protein
VDELYCSHHLAGLEALGAHVQFLGGAIYVGSDRLNVGEPNSLGSGSAKGPRTGVDVSYVLPELRAFAADVTGVSHNFYISSECISR